MWILLLKVVIILLLVRQWRLRKQIRLGNMLKTNLRCYPVLGHALELLGNNEDRMRAFENFGRDALANGGISKLWQPDQLFLCIADPVVAEIVMNACLEKHEIIIKIGSFLTGDGSVFAPVSIWRPRRKMFAPTFSMKNLQFFTESFTKKSFIMADLMEKEAGRGTFSFWKYISAYALGSVCETTLGISDPKEVENHKLQESFEILCDFGSRRICQPWFRYKCVHKLMPEYNLSLQHRNNIYDFFMQTVQDKRKFLVDKKNNATLQTPAHQDEEKISFLDLLLNNAKSDQYTDIELMQECIILVFAGTDTTSVAAAFTLLLLAKYPDIQEKLYQELQEMLGDKIRPVTSQELPRLNYLDAVAKESLRLYPPVPLAIRQIDKDITLPSGMTLVEGCGALVNIWALHRNPEYWGDDAEQFRPERFLEGPLKHPAAFMPFSYGMRGCLGYKYAMMSLKTVLATTLHRYRVLSSGDEIEIKTKFDVMLKHADNFNIKIELRNEKDTRNNGIRMSRYDQSLSNNISTN